jgi:hypothetical protein
MKISIKYLESPSHQKGYLAISPPATQGRIYWGGGLNPPLNLSNPCYKVFNPTKISLHPSYLCESL